MILITYLVGFAVALYLIGRALEERGEENSEGGVVCYLFAFLSWVAVLILVIAKKFDRL